jgi:hypothetical protein
VSGQLHPPVPLTPVPIGEEDARAGLDDMEKWKFLTPPGLELQPLGRSARSQFLYRLRYPGSHHILLGWLKPRTMTSTENLACMRFIEMSTKFCAETRRKCWPHMRGLYQNASWGNSVGGWEVGELLQDIIEGPGLVNTVMNFQLPKKHGEFHD